MNSQAPSDTAAAGTPDPQTCPQAFMSCLYVNFCLESKSRNDAKPQSGFYATQHSPRLIVVRWELVQELLDAVLLAHRVDVRNLVLGQRREVEVDLQREERRND